MPRPIRIEYENAFYHVMNRGRARQVIYWDSRYYQAFIDTLAEANQRFQCIIHAYCLMGNHYHLLLETPKANLSRIMRHINGVYTQRYNRLKKTDGPLFRGRYKAILVEKDAYLLQVSRYIHRNPIDMKKPLVRELEEYQWSSYPAYIAKVKAPTWLYRELSYQMLGCKRRYTGYASYVQNGVDEETAKHYQKGNMGAIIGDKDFKAWVREELLPELEMEEKSRVTQPDITMQNIVNYVARAWRTTSDQLTTVVKGPQKENEARKIAMYLCQELADVKLKDIAQYFNLGHIGSVSFVTHRIRKKKRENKAFFNRINELIDSIMKQAD